MAKRNPFTAQSYFWQPCVVYKETFKSKTGLFSSEDHQIAVPFFSDKIFVDKESAALFFPKFIKDLIDEESIPNKVIVDGEINEDLIQTLVRQVTVAAITPDKLEYDGRNDMPI